MKAPIALFCFNRPDVLSKTIDALKENSESSQTEIYFFSDGPRTECDIQPVQQVRALIKSIKGFKKVNIIEHEKNIGLSKNIINGVSAVLAKHEIIIVLEDDIKVSNKFLSFMNESLERYKSQTNIWHISGWNYPIDNKDLKDMFLWRVMNCWGWATWANRWQHFNKNPDEIIQNFTSEQIYSFNLDGSADFWRQVKANHQGKLDTWAIFWYATIFRNNGLCLNPTQTLVDNIGFGSGTNCITDKSHNDIVSSASLIDWPEKIVESVTHLERIKQFLRSKNPVLPLDLEAYPLNQAERSQLSSLIAQQNFSLKSSLQQIWFLMDLVWDSYGLNNQKLDYKKLQDFYSHPVWLLNGLYTETDPDSILHRNNLSIWIKSISSINKIADVGGGIGFLAKKISSYNPEIKIDVVEPFPSDYAKRTVKEYPNVAFIPELNTIYDCITLMDVLEHVEDPIGMINSLHPHIKDQGYLITGNCFKPVIKCHLPCTFHLHYSFCEIVKMLGFDFVEKIPGTHIEIFRKTRSPDLVAAREREQLSKTIYRNIMDDTSSLTASNNSLQLNNALSVLYSHLDEMIEQQTDYIIYGAGTGARLLIGALGNQVNFLVDKNPATWSTTIFGKKVHSPEALKTTTEKILISVFGRERSVIDYLLNTLKISPDRIVEIAI